MIIIYNIAGLLIGLAGMLAALPAVVLTGRLSVGLAVMAIVWMVLGFWWRSGRTSTGVRRVSGSIFFIPIQFLAIPVLLLAPVMVFVEMGAARKASDPRSAQLRTAERAMKSAMLSGDEALSLAVYKKVQGATFSGAAAGNVRVHAARQDDRMLVIVQIDNLKQFSDTAKAQVASVVLDELKAHDARAEAGAYIGVRGKLLYGAVRTPAGVKTGGSPDELLFDYFGAKPVEPQKGT